jgi:hypothetical protein
MKKKKRFQDMNTEELAAATREFDVEFVAETFGPLSARGKAAHRRARNRVGRPRIGKGTRRINITLERGLLSKADRLAREWGWSRSKVIAASLAEKFRRESA